MTLNKIAATLLLILLTACGEASPADMTVDGYVPDSDMPMMDAGVDASDAGSPDTGTEDAGTDTDVPDTSVTDAGTDTSTPDPGADAGAPPWNDNCGEIDPIPTGRYYTITTANQGTIFSSTIDLDGLTSTVATAESCNWRDSGAAENNLYRMMDGDRTASESMMFYGNALRGAFNPARSGPMTVVEVQISHVSSGALVWPGGYDACVGVRVRSITAGVIVSEIHGRGTMWDGSMVIDMDGPLTIYTPGKQSTTNPYPAAPIEVVIQHPKVHVDMSAPDLAAPFVAWLAGGVFVAPAAGEADTYSDLPRLADDVSTFLADTGYGYVGGANAMPTAAQEVQYFADLHMNPDGTYGSCASGPANAMSFGFEIPRL